MVPDHLAEDLLIPVRAVDPEVALIPIASDGSFSGSLDPQLLQLLLSVTTRSLF